MVVYKEICKCVICWSSIITNLCSRGLVHHCWESFNRCHGKRVEPPLEHLIGGKRSESRDTANGWRLTVCRVSCSIPALSVHFAMQIMNERPRWGALFITRTMLTWIGRNRIRHKFEFMLIIWVKLFEFWASDKDDIRSSSLLRSETKNSPSPNTHTSYIYTHIYIDIKTPPQHKRTLSSHALSWDSWLADCKNHVMFVAIG